MYNVLSGLVANVVVIVVQNNKKTHIACNIILFDKGYCSWDRDNIYKRIF